MVDELKQAAQQAIDVLQHYIHGGSEYRKPAEAAIAALERALTQRPAAVDVEAMLAAVLPGGYSCDPQQVADAIRDYMALTQRPAAQTEREAFAVARAFALATMASEEFVRCNGLSTGEEDEFILTGPDLTDEHATACVEHLKHVGECVAFDCDDGVIVRLGDFTIGSLS